MAALHLATGAAPPPAKGETLPGHPPLRRSKRPALAASTKSANALLLTTCAPAAGSLLSRMATTPGRLAATSTQPPLFWLAVALYQTAADRSVISVTPIAGLGT